jgi:hypothetical protein
MKVLQICFSNQSLNQMMADAIHKDHETIIDFTKHEVTLKDLTIKYITEHTFLTYRQTLLGLTFNKVLIEKGIRLSQDDKYFIKSITLPNHDNSDL